MTSRAQHLIRETLTLTAAERAGVAAELLASVDDEETDTAKIEAAGATEIEKRACRALMASRPAFRGKTSIGARRVIRKR